MNTNIDYNRLTTGAPGILRGSLGKTEVGSQISVKITAHIFE
jgi:hypothetical protein